jgi:hypothetical protein
MFDRLITDLPSIASLLWLLALIHCAIGLVAAAIAHNKGRNLSTWLIVGLIGGTFALFASIFLKEEKI